MTRAFVQGTRVLVLLVMTGVLFFTSSCRKKRSIDAPVTPTSVVIRNDTGTDLTSIALKQGESLQLIATVLPEDALNKAVTWRVSNENVAIITPSGQLVVRNAGTATITVTTQEGGLEASLVLTVDVPVVGVNIETVAGADLASISLKKGEQMQLVANVLPNTASNKAVIWTSSNSEIATISATGLLVAGNTGGTATIRATTQEGSKTSSVSVMVEQPILVESFEIRLKDTSTDISGEAISLEVGDTRNLIAAEILPTNAWDKTILWSSADETIATINADGLLTVNSIGTVIITATSKDGGATAFVPVEGLVISRVSDEDDLLKMADNLNGYYVLQNDITLTKEWIPVGNTLFTPFTGTLNGAGFTVRNLYIDKRTQSYVGLIGLNAGTVKNIGVEVDIKGIIGQSYVGVLVGENVPGAYASGSTSGSGSITAIGTFAGGLVGLNRSGTVIGYSTVAVKGSNSIGGLVGANSGIGGRVIGYATGAVTVVNFHGGGLVGSADAESDINGYAKGSVSDNNNGAVNIANMGGLVGTFYGQKIIYGYSRGSVSCSERIRGIGPVLGNGSQVTAVGLYYSGKADESEVTATRATMSNTFGNKITVTPTTTKTAFDKLVFGDEVGQWTFYDGKWPAINFPADQNIFDSVRGDKQPIEP